MKKFSRLVLFVLAIGTLLLSACGTSPATPNVGSSKVEAAPVAFIGSVDSIAGDQWVINGQTITVDPAVIRDGPFNTGDQVKVEGVVNADGSFMVSRVETAMSQEASRLPPFGNDNSNNSNSNVNDANVNANINDDNSNAANANDTNVNDDNATDVNSNDNGNSVNSNSNTNDGQSGPGGNDNNGGGDSNENGGGNDGSGGGNDNGGGGDD